MARQLIDESAHSSAPRDDVWRLVADPRTWAEWGAWSKAELLREGAPPPGGVHAVRRLRAFPTLVVEEVTVFDPPQRLGYELRSGLPLRGYRGEIALSESGGGTDIHWRAEFTPRVPGTGGLYRRVLAAFTRDAVARLAAAAERAR